MPRPTSWMSCVFPSLEHSTRRVCELPDTPRGLSKRGKTQHSMPDAARKNYLDFTPKNPPLPVTLERYGSLIFVYSLSPVRFPGCRGFLTRLCRFGSQNRHELQTSVHPFPDRPDHLSHRKRCQNRSDSKSIQMSQEEDRHAGGHPPDRSHQTRPLCWNTRHP